MSSGVQVLDRAGELRNLVTGRRPEELNWPQVWSLIRHCPPRVALSVLLDELGAPIENKVRVPHTQRRIRVRSERRTCPEAS